MALLETLLPVMLFSVGSVATTATSDEQGACVLSPADQDWVNRSVAAWNDTSERVTKIGHQQKIQAVFFDARCVVTSETAMNGGVQQWKATGHSGKVTIPNGAVIPADVISFAMGGDQKNFFVMSTPSIWRAANKLDNGLGSLETLMTHVVLHEGTHVAQIPTYGKRMEHLAERNKLPESFNDDSIQQRFESVPAFSGSIAEETALWIAAAGANDRDEAVKLARDALAKMHARQQRWFTGNDAYLTEAEDIWLSMEGSAQWAGYAWLIDPKGGNVPRDTVFASFTKGRWWSQVEGFAMFMALDRIAGESWRSHAYGDGAKTLIEMLEEATGRA